MPLTINSYKGKRDVSLDSIEYLSASGNYTLIHLLDEKPVLVSKTLSAMASQLPDFVRIHKQTLVNPAYVISCQLRKYGESTLTLSGHRVLAVSRRKTKLVYDRLCNV